MNKSEFSRLLLINPAKDKEIVNAFQLYYNDENCNKIRLKNFKLHNFYKDDVEKYKKTVRF